MAKRLSSKTVRADEGFEGRSVCADENEAKPARPKRTNALGYWSTELA